jgi:hypothetical protein
MSRDPAREMGAVAARVRVSCDSDRACRLFVYSIRVGRTGTAADKSNINHDCPAPRRLITMLKTNYETLNLWTI